MEKTNPDHKRNLKLGIEIEKEHEDTYRKLDKYIKKHGKMPSESSFYKSIALDHLKESEVYYDYLEKMEEKMPKRSKENKE